MLLKNISAWVEHFLIMPFRWFRLHYRSWRDLQQRCKVCGYRDKFDFHVPDNMWLSVVPEKFQNRVVCLSCFDDFAKKKGVDYSASIKKLYFVGDKVSLRFFRN